MLKSILLGVSIALVGSVATAQAKIVDVFYSGTLLSGVDTAGSFGSAGTDLTNSHVSVDYLFDTSLSTITSTSDGSYFSGGSLYGDVSTALSATITINSFSVAFTGENNGLLAEQSTTDYSFQSHQATSDAGDDVYSSVTAAPGALPASVLGSFGYTVQSDDTAVGAFSLANGSYGFFRPEFVSESVISAVPLPASLPMFGSALIGLGALRLVLRRSNTAL